MTGFHSIEVQAFVHYVYCVFFFFKRLMVCFFSTLDGMTGWNILENGGDRFLMESGKPSGADPFETITDCGTWIFFTLLK